MNNQLRPNQKRALDVLLAGGTAIEAANAAQVSLSTLTTWLAKPTFRAYLGGALTEDPSETLTAATLTACRVLSEIASNPGVAVNVRTSAAKGLLDNALKAGTLFDIANRLDAIESKLNEV